MATAPLRGREYGSLRAAFAKASASPTSNPGEALAKTGRRDDGEWYSPYELVATIAQY
ncbi:hypothetical protein V1278_001743 [Bradyrhizobium sp. AZCC 1577]